MSQQTILPPIEPEEFQPVTGGVYTEALVGSFSRLNPVLDYYNTCDKDVNKLLFSGLLAFNDRGQPYGDLADSWGISLDGTIYNFSIRAEAVWHDGEPVTSNDVAFTVELMRDPGSIFPPDIKELWSKVEVVQLNDKTVQFRLPESFSPFLDYVTFGVLPSHLLADLTTTELIDAPFNLHPIGSGPYRFDHLLVEGGEVVGVVLSSFEDFHAGPPFIEQFVFRYYPDASAAMAAYKAGEVMGIGNITDEILPVALKESKLNLYTGRLPQLSLILLNHNSEEVPFFEDPIVRKALLMGVNRQWIVDRILNSQAIVAHGPIFPNTWAYYDQIEKVDYDPEIAQNMLRDAGYTFPADGDTARGKEGEPPLRFDLLYPDGEPHKSIAEAIQSSWKRLGVEANLVPVPYDQLVYDYLDTRQYQAALIDLNLSNSPDPDPYPFWHEALAIGGQNYSQWSDRHASEYLEQARVLTNMDDRTKFYRSFQIRFSQELPALPLYYPVYSYAVDAEVQGVRMGPLFDPSDRFSRVTSWYLLSQPATGTGASVTATPAVTP
jgi:peptide/nickel transport system substrate-binding protein